MSCASVSVSSIHPADLADKDCHFQVAEEVERASRRNLQKHIDILLLWIQQIIFAL